MSDIQVMSDFESYATPAPTSREAELAEALPPGVGRRHHMARGALVNSAFQVGVYGLGTIERLIVATWLTRSEYGMWGVLLAALVALSWLKQAGIGDKYVQQNESNQELAFQKAFTIELGISVAFFVVAAAALPLYAQAYGRPDIIVPGLVLALAVPITAFESPAWIPYRRMQYARVRLLNAVDPITTVTLSIVLTASGMGYWGLVIGAIAGSSVGAIVCVVSSPYRLRIRFDRATARAYTGFSWPLIGFGLCTFVMIQGTTFVANSAVGLAGVGAIGLGVNLTSMSDGVDSIVSQTIYPAICAVAHQKDRLAEVFVTSNRVALLWAAPAMVGVALFASDLVHLVLGARWVPAIPMFVIVALTCGVAQVGFNWSLFLRAVDNTRPIFVAAVADVVVFLCISVPAILTLGLIGYAVGLAAITVGQVTIRSWYMRRLFGDFDPIRQLARAGLPTVPAAASVLGLRLVDGGVGRGPGAAAELALYAVVVVVATMLIERSLVRELLGYLRSVRGSTVSGQPTAAGAASAAT